MKVRLSEDQYNIYKTYLKENQESDSQKKAIKYLVDRLYDDDKSENTNKIVNEFVRNKLRGIFNVLNANKKAGKYTLGCVRILDDFCVLFPSDYEDGITLEIDEDSDQIRKQINSLNKIIKAICEDENLYNSIDKNFNGYSFAKLSHKFRDYHFKLERKESGKKSGDTNYNIVRIDSFKEASKYSKYVSWCVTHSENSYNNYTNDGNNTFYFCMVNGFADIDEDTSGLMEYANSCLAICVDPDGDLVTCTNRWNHNKDFDGHYLTVEEIENLVNVNFYDTFTPKGEYYLNDGVNRKLERIDKIKTYSDIIAVGEMLKNTPFKLNKKFEKYGIYVIELRDFGYIYSLEHERNEIGEVFNVSGECRINRIKNADISSGIEINNGVILYKNLDGYVSLCDFDGEDFDNDLNKKIKESCGKMKTVPDINRFDVSLFGTGDGTIDGYKLLAVENCLYKYNGEKLLEVENDIDGVKCNVGFTSRLSNYSGKVMIICTHYRDRLIKRISCYDPYQEYKKIGQFDGRSLAISIINDNLFVMYDSHKLNKYAYLYDYKNVVKYEHFVTHEDIEKLSRPYFIRYYVLYDNKNDVTFILTNANHTKMLKLEHLNYEDILDMKFILESGRCIFKIKVNGSNHSYLITN